MTRADFWCLVVMIFGSMFFSMLYCTVNHQTQSKECKQRDLELILELGTELEKFKTHE